jgi:cell division protease FtsH
LKGGLLKNLILWTIIAVLLITIFNNFGPKKTEHQQLSYSQFIHEVDEGHVNSVTITEQNIEGHTSSDNKFSTYLPISDPSLLNRLVDKGVEVRGKPPSEHGLLMQIFINWFPMLLLIGIWLFVLRRQLGGGPGGGGAFSFGRSRAKLLSNGQVKVTFSDVEGCNEAKSDVAELVEFLKDPQKFQRLGGRIPRGVLLVGAPGTGKTLLAKAVAGEANVPFFSISGSDFVEMFVGVGASRVRDMFEQAKKQAPCIVFIDEIDAVGRHRGAGLGGGHDEREQTLNQLLVEMDGFEGNEGVIVLAATNRPDVLDPALLRPGRFDRQVIVPLPDIRGREGILKVHLKKIPLAADVDVSVIARGTPGFSGADLANLANEAALIAARINKIAVSMRELEQAKDKVLMGSERRSMVMSEKEKRLTAYHEAGHTIVGRLMPEHDPIYKVTIIPRGRALGVTMSLPEQDRYSVTKQYLESQMAGMFGGRVAEELVFGKEAITTGASNDIQRATELAHNMVTRWGLSELGPLTFGEEQDEVFLGQSLATRHKAVSEYTAKLIDETVKQIIDRNYSRAQQAIEDNRDILEAMAEALIKYETLDADQIDDLMMRQSVREPKYVQEASVASVESIAKSYEEGKVSVPKKPRRRRTAKSDVDETTKSKD